MVKHDAKISSKAVRTGVQAGTFPGIEAKLEEAGGILWMNLILWIYRNKIPLIMKTIYDLIWSFSKLKGNTNA